MRCVVNRGESLIKPPANVGLNFHKQCGLNSELVFGLSCGDQHSFLKVKILTAFVIVIFNAHQQPTSMSANETF